MLLNLPQLVKKYHLAIRGVIDIGSHKCGEYDVYLQVGATHVAVVEPNPAAVQVLREKFGSGCPNVSIYPTALGSSYTGTIEMYTETANGGQSNSILPPKKHLEYYYQIPFTGRQQVPITTLDSLSMDRTLYNFITADVQGYELEVLKGGTQTLKGIDALCIEVNREELYQGCAMVHEIDAYLQPLGFARMETEWTPSGWGDALYVRTESVV